MKLSNRTKFLGLALIVGVLLLIWMMNSSSTPMHEGQNIGVVRKQDLTQRVTISGQVYPKRRLDVKTPYTGYVEKLYVKIGDRVKAGDPLITFSPSLGKGETNYPMRAAFSGVVTQVQLQEGEYITQADTNIVLRVDDTSELYIQASVPELDVAKVKVGQEASVKVSSLIGEIFKGVITETALSAKGKENDRWGSSSAEFQIKVLLTTRSPQLLPGMSALMDVITDKVTGTLVLGHEFIQQNEDGEYFVTMTDGEQRIITIGLQTDEAVEIKSGLKEGDEVKVIDFLSLPTGDAPSGGRGPGGGGRRR